MEVFDLTQTPDLIRPAFAAYGVFFSIGLSLIALSAWLLASSGWGRDLPSGRMRGFVWCLAVGSVAWTALVAQFANRDITEVRVMREAVIQRRYLTLEGCLAYFHAGEARSRKSTPGDETWAIGDHDFSYAPGELRLGYNRTEPNGGIVHADSRVRVSYLPDSSFGRDEIIRLEAKAHACPMAPDKK